MFFEIYPMLPEIHSELQLSFWSLLCSDILKDISLSLWDSVSNIKEYNIVDKKYFSVIDQLLLIFRSFVYLAENKFISLESLYNLFLVNLYYVILSHQFWFIFIDWIIVYLFINIQYVNHYNSHFNKNSNSINILNDVERLLRWNRKYDDKWN